MKSRLLIGVLLLIGAIFIAPISVNAQALTGNKTVGTGGDYASLTAAITDINTKGISGTLTLLINGDLTESAVPAISSLTLAGSNNLVIKPNTGKTPTVTFGSVVSNTGLTISSSSTNVGNITIDGSNTVNGTTQDMTFAVNDGTNGRYCIRLSGETDNVTIKNLKILATAIMPTTTSGTRTYGIFGSATTASAADNLTITNCTIGTSTAAYYFGIYKPDGGTVAAGTGLILSKNTVYAQHKGISIWGCAGTSAINDNTVSVIGHPTGLYVHSTLNGIYIEAWMGTVNIFNNKIITLKAKALTQTAARHLYGILIYNASGESPAGQTANIYNNFISDFSYTGDATTLTTYPSNIEAIAVDALDQTVNVYFNTIYINNTGITTNATYGIRVYDDAGMSANLKNNIIVNTVAHDSAYAIYAKTPTNNTLKSSDYNDLYVSGATASIGYYNTAKYKTLADWKTASGKDANSISINPANPFGAAGQLTSLTDLHWVSKPSVSFGGTPIAGITTDIDGATRNTTKPYMGADEGASLTSVKQVGDVIPSEFELEQNYPNPFNPSTFINYKLSSNARVVLKVYDILGNEVATLVNEFQQAGVYKASFSTLNSSLASGIYIYRLQAGSFVEAKKMILAK